MISRRGLFALNFDGPRPPAADGGWLRVHRTAMACRVEVTLDPGDGASIAAATDALNEADRVESLLTLFRDSSELARINREAAGECAGVDAEVFAVLERCVQLTADTSGAFDITSTPLSRCWGFLRREGHVPADDALAAARSAVGMSRVTLDRERRAVAFSVPGMELNLNAIGKGYALDRMAATLGTRGVRRALLSAGGSSVRALGGPSAGWPIDVRSRLVDGRIARVHLRGGALGTSGAGEQFVVENGTRYGHVIDPRTGWPAAGVVSASVVTRDAATADALSTAFLIGGPALAERYCSAHPETLALLVVNAAEPVRVYGGYTGARLEYA